jgi:superfamily I DNA/RNA helicase
MNLAADAAYISETAQSILVEMIKRAFDGEIDFNDQLYMPIIYKANFPKYNLVVVDEFQDLALLQHEMIARLLAPGGRVVGAGDRNQAIYAFRGALYDSIDRAATRFKMRRLPLTVSFRCPKLVVQECRAEVPHMESAEEASEGTIIHKAKLAAIRPGDFVVCRYNKHLVKLCFRLLARGIPATIMGREIGQSLKRIVKKFESLDIMAFMTALAQWRDIEVMNAIGKGDEARADTIRDQAEAIEIIREGRNCQTPAGIISAIDAMFTDEQNGMITLGTIHKMKGLENKRVHFLAHDLVPPPWRKDRLSQGELQQERNMRYVAKSRAQDTLTYIASAELEAPPETEPPSARPSNDQLTQTLKEI